MTGNAINAKSEALVRDLSSEELDAVSGGFLARILENSEQMQALKVFKQVLEDAAGI
jgi:hypothetical protein